MSAPGTRIDEYGSEPAFYHALAVHGTNVALIQESGAFLSYEALDQKVNAFALEHCASSQLIFLECSNSFEAITAYLACLRSNCPSFLFQAQDVALLDRLLAQYDPNAVIRWQDGEMQLARRHDRAVAMHPDLRILLSTSGSTGSPKLVKLSETNVCSNAQSIAAYLQMDSSDRSITTLKFNYSYGMSVLNSALACGASLLLTERAVTDPGFWEIARTFDATNFAGVPYTYEMLSRMESRLAEWSSLRFATQAGGRLAPEIVARFARLSRDAGWRFYVMYGQTEASPRISYLPPDQAEAYPNSVGKAVPGGTIEILDENGCPITASGVAGELRYNGPNVMMGYAEDQHQLAHGAGSSCLKTGDLAVWNEAGLVEIVGRASRFVKPFGLRINLDEIERFVRINFADAICTGTDSAIYIAIPTGESTELDQATITSGLADRYHLPEQLFQLLRFEQIPRLPSGKADYQAILREGREKAAGAAGDKGEPPRPRTRKARVEIVLSRNQIATLLVSGLWHGAAWTFVTWGFLHGILLVCQRQIGSPLKALCARSRIATRLSIPVQMAFVFTAVAFTRIFFRSPDVATAGIIVGKIAHGPYSWKGLDSKADIALCLACVAALTVVEGAAERGFWRRFFRRRRILRCAAAMTIFLLTLLLGEFQGGRFVYVRF